MQRSSRIAAAIVIAGALVALALYLRPVPDRYSYQFSGGEIRRFDTATGEALVCAQEECAEIVQKGRRLSVEKR